MKTSDWGGKILVLQGLWKKLKMALRVSAVQWKLTRTGSINYFPSVSTAEKDHPVGTYSDHTYKLFLMYCVACSDCWNIITVYHQYRNKRHHQTSNLTVDLVKHCRLDPIFYTHNIQVFFLPSVFLFHFFNAKRERMFFWNNPNDEYEKSLFTWEL